MTLPILLLTAVVHAQTPPPEPHFEVASVRPNRKSACRGRWGFTASHGTVIAENAPLLRIISRAFNLTDDRVSGPSWLDSECYDIKAKAPAGAQELNLMPMLQTLLKERFQLTAELESVTRPIFALLIDKSGLKLQPYGRNVPVSPPANDGKILFMARHLPDLCERLGKVTGRPVIDQTGLDGDYMIVLTYLPFGSMNSDPSDSASDILAAVRDQLGLRLQSQHGPVEILKIGEIRKIPTPN